jgi:hypothetical protein
MENRGIFYDHLAYFKAIGNIWYILWSFGIFFPISVFCTKENLATLFVTTVRIYPNFARMVSHDTVRHKNRLPFKKTLKIADMDPSP